MTRTCKVCGRGEPEVEFYKHGRTCRLCKREQVKVAAAARRARDPERVKQQERERLERSRLKRGAYLRHRQLAKKAASDGSAPYFGSADDLDHERRCYHRFFTVRACSRRVAGGREGWWWCSVHDPAKMPPPEVDRDGDEPQ